MTRLPFQQGGGVVIIDLSVGWGMPLALGMTRRHFPFPFLSDRLLSCSLVNCVSANDEGSIFFYLKSNVLSPSNNALSHLI